MRLQHTISNNADARHRKPIRASVSIHIIGPDSRCAPTHYLLIGSFPEHDDIERASCINSDTPVINTLPNTATYIYRPVPATSSMPDDDLQSYHQAQTQRTARLLSMASATGIPSNATVARGQSEEEPLLGRRGDASQSEGQPLYWNLWIGMFGCGRSALGKRREG
jgi:hypothetical protein